MEESHQGQAGSSSDEPSRETWTVEGVIAALNSEYDGTLPVEAIRAAQRMRDRIVPQLIQLMESATESARRGDDVEPNGHLFALFLLTEFRAREALPAILEAMSLPGELTLDLYGDSVTGYLYRVLAALADEQPQVVEDLLTNANRNFYVRWQAAQTYLLWVRDGRLTRDDAVERLRCHLRAAVAEQNPELVGAIIGELLNFVPHEAIPEIRQAFERGQVEDSIVNMKSVERTFAEADERQEMVLEHALPTGIDDTVAELSVWAGFQPEGAKPFSPPEASRVGTNEMDSDLDGLRSEFIDRDVDYYGRPVTSQLLNTGIKTKPNEPCPCGSGRKFKKCCGKNP
ncbi:MAG: DUF1186 domain-containing protein [Planctomycetaceae bacterium]